MVVSEDYYIINGWVVIRRDLDSHVPLRSNSNNFSIICMLCLVLISMLGS